MFTLIEIDVKKSLGKRKLCVTVSSICAERANDAFFGEVYGKLERNVDVRHTVICSMIPASG